MQSVKSNRLLQTVRSFLKKHYLPGKPLLLGYSGGYDSELLLHLLLSLRKDIPFELHLAHVDHGWRKESAGQADDLRKKASNLGCPFHCKRLTEKNGEEDARLLRFSFFKSLFEVFDFQALILGHQKNDLAETVFKRFLEGAYLPYLFGMEETGIWENMVIWRPLLSVSRKEILDSVQENNLTAIDDAANRDITYLRARMRQDLLPYVEKSFGKSILQNIAEASLRSAELKKYLDGKTQNAWEAIIQGPLGSIMPMTALSALEKVEKTHLLKRICREKKIELSRPLLQQLLIRLDEQNKRFQFFTKEAFFLLDRGYLFIQTHPFPPLENAISLKEGVWERDRWRVSVVRSQERGKDQNSWVDFWKNEAVLYLPDGEYHLFAAKPGSFCTNGSSLKKWLEVHKTLAFMRKHLPVIYQGDKIAGEFLSGKSLCKIFQGLFWKVVLEIV